MQGYFSLRGKQLLAGKKTKELDSWMKLAEPQHSVEAAVRQSLQL